LDDDIIADIAKVGLDIIVKASGFTDYLYGIGANDSMEIVFCWRLSSSPKNRAAIPEPFLPTPIHSYRLAQLAYD
jgi:hypothetical protein